MVTINGIFIFVAIGAVLYSAVSSLVTDVDNSQWENQLATNDDKICSNEEECHVSESCLVSKCVNACINQTCGLYEGCQLNNQHSFVCSCLPNYYRNYTTDKCVPKPKWEIYTPQLANDTRLVYAQRSINRQSVVVRLSAGQGDVLPGSGVIREDSIEISLFSRVSGVYQGTQVLLIEFGRYNWFQSSNGNIPHNAIVGGKLNSGETVYICRVYDRAYCIVGVMQPSNYSCNYESGGQVKFTRNYELLVHEIQVMR